jgi:hypothetical protein
MMMIIHFSIVGVGMKQRGINEIMLHDDVMYRSRMVHGMVP